MKENSTFWEWNALPSTVFLVPQYNRSPLGRGSYWGKGLSETILALSQVHTQHTRQSPPGSRPTNSGQDDFFFSSPGFFILWILFALQFVLVRFSLTMFIEYLLCGRHRFQLVVFKIMFMVKS